MRVAKKIAPGMDAKAMTAEIKERLSDELDYEQEAQAQRAFARALRGHPFVVIPDVVTSLSREQVLVTEWVEGIGFEEVRELPQADRDRYGEIDLPLLLRLDVPQRASSRATPTPATSASWTTAGSRSWTSA